LEESARFFHKKILYILVLIILCTFRQKIRTSSATGFRIQMPRTINRENRRQSVRVPVPMIEEISRIVREHAELHYNRQQFIESAVREKIEKTQLIKARNPTNP
jgi:hypothetical protein